MIQQILPQPIYQNSSYYYACTSCKLQENGRNYCTFDKNEVDYFVKQKENAIPYLTDILVHSDNEAQVT